MPSAEKEPPRDRSRDSARRPGARPTGPNRLGKYELIARIGKGGMAQVYLARQRGPANFEKVVVVKTIHPHLAEKEAFIEMLLDEARIAALLKHPCVVDIYDLGLEDDTYFIAMEYLSGEPLLSVLRAGRVKSRPIDIHGTARIIADVADGLHAAHELHDNAGHHLELVHRDVTPGNIVVLYNGQVKIVDFGIAKARGRLASETDARKLKGKLGYVSPEQIRGENADRRADIFALGVVMWEALTYRRLFRGNNPGTVLAAIVKEKLQPPSSVRPEVPAGLDAICMRALARKPDDRYATAHEMHADIEAFLTSAGAPPQRKAIASYMEDVFAEQIKERARILREMHESSAAAGPQDATAAFAASRVAGDEDEDSGAGASEDTADDLAGGEAGQKAADQAAAPAPRTPGDGLSAVSVTPAGMLPSPVTDEIDGRTSSLTAGSSGELAARHAPVDAVAEEAARRRRWRIAAVVGGVVFLIGLLVVLQDSEPSQTSSGQSSDRLFAAGGATGQSDEPAPAPTTGPATAAAAAADAATGENPTATADPGQTQAVPGRPGDPAGEHPAAGAGTGDEALEIHEDGQGSESAEDHRRRTSSHRDETESAQGTETERPRATESSTDRPPPAERTERTERTGTSTRKRAEALYQEGVGLFVQGELLAAQLKFREALELSPGYAPAYRGMGMIHQAGGQKKQAARAYREYLRLSPRARDRAEIEARLQQVGG
ncbi:MAG TPA: protein kinase [Haliangium sp.]|nr:protein kinase [Haliangium sp.]